MSELIFTCDAFDVHTRDEKSVTISTDFANFRMSLEEILAFGKAIVKYFETERGVNVSFN